MSSYQPEGDNIRESGAIESTSDTEHLRINQKRPCEGGQSDDTESKQSNDGRQQSDGLQESNGIGGDAPGNEQPSPGVKRGRSGRPMSSPGSRQELDGPSLRSYRRSHSDSESNSDSGSSSESEYDDYDKYEDEVVDLNPSHPLLAIRSNLVDFVYGEGKSWIRSAIYTTPHQDRLPPKKRYRTIDDKFAFVKCEEGADGSLIARRFDGFYHLACPYYITKPEKYKSCLLGHSLQSIEDVIGHLIHYHKEPPYCPICRQEFDSPWVRDQHVRARICSIQNSGKVDGVNEQQRYKLRKRDQVHLGEAIRWMRVWNTVFPGIPLPESPYLHTGVDVAVVMMRDYWATQGLKLAEDYLGSF
ncbi:unnamed protein product [Clonostachys solani]|uniref:C2H2-type domain-containing protein n=1 Tax=Clonostachys solani TaxID=160281 RepID=A0A9P0EJW7_9HYPO|nr:unnamed protein product [Clonostachys solani]